MVNEDSTHPVQTKSYGTVLGIILFFIFIIILLLIFYFLFGTCMLNSYCFIIGNTSCYCPNAPACCEFIPGTAESCTFIQNQEQVLRAYCANNPCYEGCIKNADLPIQNVIADSGLFPDCDIPDPILLQQGVRSSAHLCQFKDICNFNPVKTICKIPDINVCEINELTQPIQLQQCALPFCGVNKSKNIECLRQNCFIPVIPVTPE